MPNRCYLYAANRGPDGIAPIGPPCIGISDHSHSIPLVHKILVSVNPHPCLSRNWDLEEPIPIAVVGDFDGGVRRLEEFFDRITNPALAEMKTNALEFLHAESNRRKYFRMEPFEIFWLEDIPPDERMQELMEQIEELPRYMDAALARLDRKPIAPPPPRGFFSRIFSPPASPSPKPVDPIEWGYSIGLDKWSNVLCFMPYDG